MIKNVPIILNLQFYIIIAFYFSAVLALHTTLSTTRYPLIRWGGRGCYSTWNQTRSPSQASRVCQASVCLAAVPGCLRLHHRPRRAPPTTTTIPLWRAVVHLRAAAAEVVVLHLPTPPRVAALRAGEATLPPTTVQQTAVKQLTANWPL